MSKKLLLISPKTESWWDSNHLNLPPYNLATLAAMTPENWEIEIIDERVKQLDGKENADLVGITVMTSLAPRAYEISETFLKRGIPVVLGGIHPTVCPEEAGKYATTVVRGEAESSFTKLLEDFEKGEIKSVYVGGHDDINVRPARYDLLTPYGSYLVQTTRGCPYNCEFCSVSTVYGFKRRHRDLETVMKEIQETPTDKDTIVFADDNFFGKTEDDKRYAATLLKKLVGMNKKWAGQATIDIAYEDEMLELASRSGCTNLLIGFESINEDSLREANKKMNLKIGADNFINAVKRIHNYGISVSGTFIFGFDTDDKDIFERTVEFVRKTGIDANRFEILTPLPGTRLYERLNNKGRIIYRNYPDDWKFYDFSHAVFEPKNMSSEELERYMLEALRETSSFDQSARRAIKTFYDTSTWRVISPSDIKRRLYGSGISYRQNAFMGKIALERLRSMSKI